MKKHMLMMVTCFAILVLSAGNSLAQNNPGSFIGFSSGINHGGFVALGGDFKVSDKVSFAPTLGLSTWGFKFSGDFKIYRQAFSSGTFFLVGVSRATGLPGEVEIELQTKSNVDPQLIMVKLHPVNNLNLGIGYAWLLGGKVRFSMDMGYAVKISSGARYDASEEIDEAGQWVMNLMRPGGLRLGLGLAIGF
jgi:hypothetical protein